MVEETDFKLGEGGGWVGGGGGVGWEGGGGGVCNIRNTMWSFNAITY